MYEIVNEGIEMNHPLRRFSGYSGMSHPSFKNKDYSQILSELTSLHSLVSKGYHILCQDIVEHNGKALYPLTEKYYEDLTFKDISYDYLKGENSAKGLLRHLVLASVLRNPNIGLIREKIIECAEMNLFDSSWAEAAYAVKCSYTTTHLLVFLLERYSFRSLQGWFQVTEKNKGDMKSAYEFSIRYSINRDIPPEPRYIGVGYKDKPASTPEHKKLVNITDSRNHVEKKFHFTHFGMSNSFCDDFTLEDLENYSKELKIKILEFNKEETEYEEYCSRIKQERINCRRAIQPTEGPNPGADYESRKAPSEVKQYSGGNYSSSSRNNQKVKSYEEFREKLRKEKERFYRTFRKSDCSIVKREPRQVSIYEPAALHVYGFRVYSKVSKP